jgi:uncharacterized protein YdeI (BOF family)
MGTSFWPARLLPSLLLVAVSGCHGSASHQLGAAIAGSPVETASVRGLPKGSRVVVRGEIVEKCPVAGCWFILKDKTGTLRVDTKAAGFVVLDVPVHTTVLASGKMSRQGEEPQLMADGVTY